MKGRKTERRNKGWKECNWIELDICVFHLTLNEMVFWSRVWFSPFRISESAVARWDKRFRKLTLKLSSDFSHLFLCSTYTPLGLFFVLLGFAHYHRALEPPNTFRPVGFGRSGTKVSFVEVTYLDGRVSIGVGLSVLFLPLSNCKQIG